MTELQNAIDAASTWMDIEGVEGVADGLEDGKDCIVVGYSCAPEDLLDRIPKTFHGYPVVLREWGSISALESK